MPQRAASRPQTGRATSRRRRRRPTPNVPALRVTELSKQFGGVTAVADLSFEVGWGRVTALLGPNGAGKSTTLKILLGLAAASSGRAEVLGRPYASLPIPARRVGAVLETSQFHPGRTARTHLTILADAIGLPSERVASVLSQTGLEAAARRKVGGFSLGMRQRLALAGALLGNPRILILDEPFNGLDPSGIRWLRSLVAERAARGDAVLVSSHLLTEVEQIADEVIVMHQGRLRAHETVKALAKRRDLETAFFDLIDGATKEAR